MKSIICTDCGEPIKYKNDLKICGKLIQPYHVSCIDSPKSKSGKMNKFLGCFPLGFKFWFWLLTGNLILAMLIKKTPESTTELAIFLTVFNAVYIFARIGIYYSYEKHLQLKQT